MRIAVFVSGGGTNLQSIIDAAESGKLSAEVSLVLSSKSDAYALERARRHNIPAVYLSSKEFQSRDYFLHAMFDVLDEHKIDFIALAGYMKKVPPEIVKKYKNRITNIHPALLPAFGGKGMYGMRVHQAVIEYGCKVTGVTIHIVDEEYDHGPIVAQKCVPVSDQDTPETLAERVLAIEHLLYPQVLEWFAQDKVIVSGNIVKVSQ
ncbi:phosphoribosylglycinamide formyltransferase [bacterium]|nr:phosphoribosylglycinamide formyltransferase [bacterium]